MSVIAKYLMNGDVRSRCLGDSVVMAGDGRDTTAQFCGVKEPGSNSFQRNALDGRLKLWLRDLDGGRERKLEGNWL